MAWLERPLRMLPIRQLRSKVTNLVDLCVRGPRLIKNWPTFLYHDIRLRLGRPGHPKISEVIMRDGTRLGVVKGRVGLYPVLSEVWIHAHYDRKPQMRIRPDDPDALAGRLRSSGFTVEATANHADETGYIWAHR